jgi:RNA polymerase sigma factor (sigma-70 family)
MATASLGAFLRQLRRSWGPVGEGTDGQLLARFLAGGDEVVFEAIVRRHGPMVYRVCWRVLQQQQDAEDAFQATFLVLARKPGAVRKRASLASFLHGVAHRVALKAKARADSRRRHERQAVADLPPAPDGVTWEELRAALDAELATLPEKWRLPLILCYLEGRTQDEAAALLDWGKNTVRRRLDEGREALGRRLRRRGHWPEALAAVLLSDSVAPAAPAALARSAVEAAARVVAGEVPGVSAEVVALAEGIVQAPSAAARFAAVVLLGTGLLAGVGLSAYHATPGSPTAQEQSESPGQERIAHAKQADEDFPVVWEMDFEDGVPGGFPNGRFVKDGLPRGSKGAAGAVECDRGKEGVFYRIATPQRWADGLFAVRADSHLHFTFKMDRPDWVNVFLHVRTKGPPRGAESINYLFNDLRFWPPRRGQWRTVSIPLSKFGRAGGAPGRLSADEVPYMVQFSSLGDRGLVIDRVWVTRGGPGDVRYTGVE